MASRTVKLNAAHEFLCKIIEGHLDGSECALLQYKWAAQYDPEAQFLSIGLIGRRKDGTLCPWTFDMESSVPGGKGLEHAITALLTDAMATSAAVETYSRITDPVLREKMLACIENTSTGAERAAPSAPPPPAGIRDAYSDHLPPGSAAYNAAQAGAGGARPASEPLPAPCATDTELRKAIEYLTTQMRRAAAADRQECQERLAFGQRLAALAYGRTSRKIDEWSTRLEAAIGKVARPIGF